MAKFCTNCGRKMEDDDVFCPSCGTVSGERPQTVPQPTMPLQQSEYPQGAAYPQVVYVRARPTVPGRGFGIASLVMGLVNLVPSLVMIVAVTFAIVLWGHMNQPVQKKASPLNLQPGAYQSEYEQKDAFDYYHHSIEINQNYEKEDNEEGVVVALSVFCLVSFIPMSVMTLLFAKKARKRGYVNGVSQAGLFFGVFEVALCVLCVVAIVIGVLTTL